jgi:hypothetical protein
MARRSRSSTRAFTPDDDRASGFADPFASDDLWFDDGDPFAEDDPVFDDGDPFAERSGRAIDPARLPPPGSLERMAQEEVDEIAQSFRQRMQRENRRLDFVLDSDYWCCLVFQSSEQLLAFLNATGWRRLGERYIDGLAVARAMNIDLPPAPAWPRISHDPIWEEFVEPYEERGDGHTERRS